MAITTGEKTLKKILKKQFGWRTKPEFRDDIYLLFPVDEISRAISQLPHAQEYSRLYDCDDQADWFLAHLKKALPGIAAFYIKALSPDKLKAHAWPAVIDDTETIIHIEKVRDRKKVGDEVVSVDVAIIDSDNSLIKDYPTVRKVLF